MELTDVVYRYLVVRNLEKDITCYLGHVRSSTQDIVIGPE